MLKQLGILPCTDIKSRLKEIRHHITRRFREKRKDSELVLNYNMSNCHSVSWHKSHIISQRPQRGQVSNDFPLSSQLIWNTLFYPNICYFDQNAEKYERALSILLLKE